MPLLTVYADGSCLGNPGKGGWAYIAFRRDGSEICRDSGGFKSATNNAMELHAVIEALKMLEDIREHGTEIMICTDSKYVIDGASKWSANWIKNGWKTAAGDSVKNRILWEKLLELIKTFHVKWTWVKGHNGDTNNELVDGLARAAAELA